MDKHFSRYLDLIRFTAAVLVVLAHLLTHGMFGFFPKDSVPDLGREAVIVFFLMSGFVIAFTTSEKSLSLRQYVVARTARIYSVAIPVVLICFLLVYLASWFVVIPGNSAYQLQRPYIYLPLHLLFLGELWNLSETPPWLVPYWSLGYEVWYYVLFGVMYYLRGSGRLLLGTVVLLVMGFKLWLLLPIWLAGVYLYAYAKELPLTRNQARTGWLATLFLLFLYKATGLDVYLRVLGTQIWPFQTLHLGSAERYLADYAVCILIYFNFAMARKCAFSGLQTFDKPIRALAAYTFTLYLIHSPVMEMWALFYHHDPASAVDIFLLCAIIGLATYVTGFVTEHRKVWFQDRFDDLYKACVNR